jgi:hypothetical protein
LAVESSSKVLRFEQAFDGTQVEILPEELDAAATAFSLFVDSLCEASASNDVNQQLESTMLMHLELDTENYEVFVDNFSELPGCDKYLSILHLVDNSLGGDSIEYRLGNDGIVRRLNFEKTAELRQIHMHDQIHPSMIKKQIHSERVQKIIAYRLEQEERNLELETKLRLNNQPVGLEEINQLIAIISTARPVADS